MCQSEVPGVHQSPNLSDVKTQTIATMPTCLSLKTYTAWGHYSRQCGPRRLGQGEAPNRGALVKDKVKMYYYKNILLIVWRTHIM